MKPETLQALVDIRAGRASAVLITDLDDGRQSLLRTTEDPQGSVPWIGPTLIEAAATAARRDRSRVAEHEGRRYFLQVFSPPLRLVVVGAVHISQALVPMAALAGYDVTVVDPRRAFASDERFPGVAVRRDWPDEALDDLSPDARTAIVTLTHDPKLDDPALDRALHSPAFYIAALGSRKTHAARLERLSRLGHDAVAHQRIHGPAGLPLGAETPAEIAVSVMAQMTQVLRREPTS